MKARTPAKKVKAVHRDIRRDLLQTDAPAVIVDSPPGAGKSTFVVDTVPEVVRAQGQTPIVSQTNNQADDLVRKLRSSHPKLMVGRLHGASYTSPFGDDRRVVASKTLDDLDDCDVVVAPSAKWSYCSEDHCGRYRIGVIDEAYQMRSDQLMYVAPLFGRALFVGDPGQLDPFTPVNDERWRGYADGPVNPAVATVRHNHPTAPVHRLPVSWRLSARCAPLVSEAFYPDMPFAAGTTADDRSMRVAKAKKGPVGKAISLAAETGWAYLELPHRIVPATDVEATETVVDVVVQLLTSGVEVAEGGKTTALAPNRVAVAVAHRAQRAALRVALADVSRRKRLDVAALTIDTANSIQGREYDVVVVLHPLSGRSEASEFHLETGRLCVMLSRHRHACIVVGREGIVDVLDDHPMSAPVWIGAPIPVPDGWEANQVAIETLLQHRVRKGT